MLTACGRISFDPLASADGSASVPDAGVPLEFGPAMPIPVSTAGASDDDVTLTDDMLELYFISTRAGGSGGDDIWLATRNSTTDPFGAPQPVGSLNTAMSEETCEIAGDGLTMWFASDRPPRTGTGGHDLWFATRPDRASS